MNSNRLTNKLDLNLRETNKQLNEWEKYYQKEILTSLPISVMTPTGDKCNLKCEFCVDRNSKSAESFGDVTFDTFLTHYVEPLYYASEVEFCSWGEPLANPDCKKMFMFVTRNFPGLYVIISTNGLLMNEDWSERLASHESEVNISLNAATHETYETLMKSNKFDSVISNIRKLIKIRRKYRRKNPFISLSIVTVQQNIKELPEFVDLAAQLGVDQVIVQDLMIIEKHHEKFSLINKPELARSMFLKAVEKAKEKGIQIDSYVTYSSDYFTKDNRPIKKNRGEFSLEGHLPEGEHAYSFNYSQPVECPDPWQNFKVGLDGSVGVCCRSGTAMGNIFRQSLSEIWNGPMYRYFRRTVNTNNPPSECSVCPVKTGCQ